ncbi:MAG: DUF4430 domain-containing protein [Solirubrobacteraceae bacterium]
MRRTMLLALAGTIALAVSVALAGTLAGTLAEAGTLAQRALAAGSASGPPVTIRIEGSSKTLLIPTRVRTHSGSITKYGAPKGKCPAHSAQGALDVATHGRWHGKWYDSYNEYFISSILGEKPPSTSDFWDIFVNNKPSSVGACDVTLHRGDQLVFADTSGKEGVSALRAPHTAIAGRSFRVKLLGYSTKGQSTPLRGVRITGNGITPVRTNRSGVAHVLKQNPGVLVLRAAPEGYVRTEAVVHLAHR